MALCEHGHHYLQGVTSDSGLARANNRVRQALSVCVAWMSLSGLAAAQTPPTSPIVSSLLEVAATRAIDDDPTWQALSAWTGESPRKAVSSAIRAIWSSGNPCVAPARYLWLQSQLNAPELPVLACPEFAEFLDRAPADQIALVFASENFSQPSSALGHLFIRLSGRRAGETVEVQHSVSFFAEAGGWNLPALAVRSLITGMRGHFALGPFAEQQVQYLEREGRSLWIHNLTLEPERRLLVLAYLLELRDRKMTYYFHRNNCATVIDQVLTVAAGSGRALSLWVSPKDVIKRAVSLGVVSETSILAPPRWIGSALAATLGDTAASTVYLAMRRGDQINSDQMSPDVAGLRLALAEVSLPFMALDDSRRRLAEQEVRMGQSRQHGVLAPSAEKEPARTPADSQIAVGWRDTPEGQMATLSVRPASHGLEDDNRAYWSESELLLFDAEFVQPLQADGGPALNRLSLFSARSRVPRREVFGGRSIDFGLVLERRPQHGAGLELRLQGGAGLTKRWTEDVDVYLGVHGGARTSPGAGVVFLGASGSLIVREVFSMKTVVDWRASVASKATLPIEWDLRVSQSKFLGGSWSIHADWAYTRHSRRTATSHGLRVKRLF